MKETLRTTMRMKWLAALLVLGTWATTSTAQVTVTATAGTPGPSSYTTLNDAFAAINAGTHQGDVVVAIGANTTETGPCVLNSSGAGSAVYTTVNIHPTADGVSVSGPTTTGRGLIELNGADNVTIDGDNPNTGGTNRNLSIINSAANTVTLTSCIRLATSAAVTSADNNAVKNLILTGSATGRNVAGTASTTGSENNTFGIVISGNAGATASGPPVAITSETGTAPSGTTVNALLLDNNEINACARGIVFSGANAAVSSGVTISNNIIGGAGTLTGNAPFTAVTTTVYTKGIWVAGTTAVSVTGNTLRNILSYVSPINITGIELASAIGTGTISIQNNTINGLAENNTASAASAPKAILISNAGAPYTVANNTVTNVQWAGYSFTASQVLVGIELNTTAASATVERNKVSKIYNNNTNTLGVYGINVAGGSNISIYNNFVSDILNDMTGGLAFSTQYGLFGIRINAGTGHKINYNTVSLSGTRFGTPASSLLSAALCIVATTRTGLEVKNNILSNTITGGTTSIAEVALYLPSGGTSGMNLTLNNNYYYSGTDAARQGIAQVSTTSNVANLYQASNFNPAATTPTTNLRAYTSTLSAAGTNDNASGASTAAAPFVSSTDFHINNLAVNATDLDGKGAVIAGITTDIDGAVRNASTPDIGADEFDLPPCSAANGGTITPTTYTRCQGQTVSLASTGATTGSGITYQWKAGATP
ncbi:MAG TPA: hypothetical protein VK154_07780, partial [Chitinophagales bacterium]|nr:hypothetical protein [Chitinophagales bacterium]